MLQFKSPAYIELMPNRVQIGVRYTGQLQCVNNRATGQFSCSRPEFSADDEWLQLALLAKPKGKKERK